MKAIPVLATALLGFGIAAAAEKKLPAGQAANERVEIKAVLYPDKDAIRSEVGSDLGGYYLLVSVTLAPKGGDELEISPDDFLLRSDKDGQRCGPMAPSQVAGSSALVISSKGGGGGFMAENPGPVWGGYPGTGRPERLGGESATLGNTGESTSEGRVESTKDEDPVLATLKRRVLPVKESREPVSGLLYFLLEGKHKPKELELLYSGPAGKLALRFK